ncbi:MAG: XdhC/CoxI family protein [Pseudomonadota bacterium]
MRQTDHDHIPEIALDWHRQGLGAVLATVVETWGSAPRAVGAQLAISGAGEIMGSVSGGCVEGAVVAEALEALEEGQARLMEFGVSEADAFAVGLACGGTIRVLVEPVGAALAPDLLADLVARRAAREAVAVETRFALDGAPAPTALVRRLDHRLLGYAEAPVRFEADRSGLDADDPGRLLTVHNPPLRLAIVGAVHIAQALSAMARTAGYDVALIDPRAAFASPVRFPGERLIHDWPDAALDTHGLDRRTGVVTLTHDPKLDDPALLRALASPAFYVGALGSVRTHAKRVERLRAAGLGEDCIARLEAPVGLDIGARTPAEIAVATLAQITERLRRPETRPGTGTTESAA